MTDQDTHSIDWRSTAEMQRRRAEMAEEHIEWLKAQAGNAAKAVYSAHSYLSWASGTRSLNRDTAYSVLAFLEEADKQLKMTGYTNFFVTEARPYSGG